MINERILIYYNSQSSYLVNIFLVFYQRTLSLVQSSIQDTTLEIIIIFSYASHSYDSFSNFVYDNSPEDSEKYRFSLVQFSRSVMSDSLQPHKSQHARPPCPLPTPGVH